jgi:hypothetical protein
MPYGKKKNKPTTGNGNGIVDLTRELWQAAVKLRGLLPLSMPGPTWIRKA